MWQWKACRTIAKNSGFSGMGLSIGAWLVLPPVCLSVSFKSGPSKSAKYVKHWPKNCKLSFTVLLEVQVIIDVRTYVHTCMCVYTRHEFCLRLKMRKTIQKIQNNRKC